MFTTNAFDYENNQHNIELHNLAFLVGNGINRHSGSNYTWQDLLKETFPDEFQKIFDRKSIENKNSIDNYLEGLSYPEMAELAFRLRQKEEKSKLKDIKEYKSEIVEKTKAKEGEFFNFKHNKLVTYARKYDLPILTTNYDKCLLKTLNCYSEEKNIRINWLHEIGEKKADWKFLTNAYFSDKKISYSDKDIVCRTFAIWHIHGIAISSAYNDSIRITNRDYAESIANLKNYIKSMKKNEDTWEGNYTWINIILNNDLIIAGLGLEQSEIDLRWLLVERYIYHKGKERKARDAGLSYRIPNTIYVYSDEMKNGTKMLFDALGIKFIKKSYDKIFDFNEYLCFNNY